jgi:hypothetical protein
MGLSYPAPWRRRLRVLTPWLIVVTVAVLGVYGWRSFRLNTGRDPRIAPYQARVAAYTDESVFCPSCPYCAECDLSFREALRPGDTFRDPERDTGYLRGKVVIVDVFNGVVMPLILELPDDLRPAAPEEVQSAVWLRNSSRGVGTYAGGARAEQGTIELTIVDLAEGLIVGTGTLVGPEPPPFIVGHDPGAPARPSDHEVIAYLSGLPRR